ncbi:MAG: hypothetical protein LUI13_10555 [Lachnospiraceae bacterium]|nr:hypothetical protein [Lachnospiraceae bacterium]
MYKVELKFNDSLLSPAEKKKLYEQTDCIFEEEDLKRADCEPGKRVYLDQGRSQDYGHFWAAIFALKNSEWITGHLQECFWYNGSEKENLITEFMRV